MNKAKDTAESSDQDRRHAVAFSPAEPWRSAMFIVGPTAVGKSAVALEVARRIGGEIVSCDAMQVYREISIASDKPSEEMRRDVCHHLIDVVSVTENFNVASYRQLAVEAIEDIQGRKRVPVVCGGSGMYMMALLDGIFEGAERDPVLRARLEQELVSNGLAGLHARLAKVDAEAAARIKPTDRQRIIRALEVFDSTGVPISQLRSMRKGLWGSCPVIVFALRRPREELYARAEARIEEMFMRGLVDEVRKVIKLELAPSASRLIGIPEVAGFLEGRHDLAATKELFRRNTRRYIKRQMTWFRKDLRLHWVDVGREESAGETAENIIARWRSSTG